MVATWLGSVEMSGWGGRMGPGTSPQGGGREPIVPPTSSDLARGTLARSIRRAGGPGSRRAAGPERPPDQEADQGGHAQGPAPPLGEFQLIADRNGDNRASGLPATTASADYVAWTMRKAGYKVTRQPFDFPYFEEFGSSFSQVAPTPATTSTVSTDDLMDCSGDGAAEAAVRAGRPGPDPAARLDLGLRGGRLPAGGRRHRQDRADAARHAARSSRRWPTRRQPARSVR